MPGDSHRAAGNRSFRKRCVRPSLGMWEEVFSRLWYFWIFKCAQELARCVKENRLLSQQNEMLSDKDRSWDKPERVPFR